MWFPCLLLSGAARHTRKLRFVRRSTAGVCCWCEVKLRPDGSPFLAMYLATVDARELRSSLLPPNAQTWVNRHVLFTHGNGVVMSPVTRKSTEGLPLFYLRDIPPVATGGPEIREPRISYGEETDTYVIVKGSTPEFDYPKGKDNIYAAYDGTGGIRVAGIARRILFAWYFNDLNLLFSNYITGDRDRKSTRLNSS